MFTLIIWVCGIQACSVHEISGTYSNKESCVAAQVEFMRSDAILDRGVSGSACIPSPENGYFE